MKEIVLDLAEIAKTQYIKDQLVDFAVAGPGPRRILNWINNRRWFENERDRLPACEKMYVEELRQFRIFLQQNTVVDELRELNLLGVQESLSYTYASSPLPSAPQLKIQNNLQFAL